MLGDDGFRGGVQIPGAAVIAESRPEFEDLWLASSSECVHIGKAAEEAVVVGNHGCDARLLQHNFGHPDAVGIAVRTPWQLAAVYAKPRVQARLKSPECARL